MSLIVKQFRVNTGQGIYLPGDIIEGLDAKSEKALVASGYCEYLPEQKQVSSEPPATTFDRVDIDGFSKLPASEQNELLKSLGIEPGSNKDSRIQQYQAWLCQKFGDGNINGDESGPNTSL